MANQFGCDLIKHKAQSVGQNCFLATRTFRLTRTLLLVSLFASLAIAASFPVWIQEQQRRPIDKSQTANVVEPTIVRLAQSSLPAVGGQSQQELAQELASSIQDQVVLNDFNENVVNNEIEADDEEFLRHLRVAAKYLDAKLANERHLNGNFEFADDNNNNNQLSPRYNLLAEPEANDDVVSMGQSEALANQPRLVEYFATAPQQETTNIVDDASTQQLTTQPLDSKTNQLMNYLLLLDKAHEAGQDISSDHQEETIKTTINNEATQKRAQDEHYDDKIDSVRIKQEPKLTTLLEDESELEKDKTILKKQRAEVELMTTTTTPQSETITTASYGKLIRSADNEHQIKSSAETSGEQKKGPVSVFSRLYQSLTKYLPFFNQINILKSVDTNNETNEDKTHHSMTISLPSSKVKVQSVKGAIEGEVESKTLNKSSKAIENSTIAIDDKSRSQTTKLSVSNLQNEQPKEIKEGAQDDKLGQNSLKVKLNVSDDQEIDSNELNEPKLAKVRVSSASKRLSVSLANNNNNDNAGQDQQVDDERDLSQMIATNQHQIVANPAANFQLLRDSNMLVPLRNNDLLVAEGPNRANQQPVDSLLGRYIYAPTQHYYLGSSGSNEVGGSSTRPAPGQLESYNGHLKPAYAYERDPNSAASILHFANLLANSANSAGPNRASEGTTHQSLANKTNDLYFLFVVGAFCMAAMSVVLAAGLFAYRVQQQRRKSSQDGDYPTYGVVGPNNMVAATNGKCGAGYFGSPLSSAGSGSGRHLAQMYAANAANMIDSGLDKSSISTTTSSSRSSGKGGSNNNNKSKKNKPNSTSSQANADQLARNGTNSTCVPNSILNSSPAQVATPAGNQDAARMYHYQHQKQQMISSDRSSAGGRHTSASDLDSEDENDEDGSYTVYECPGLASAHEMEIKNPLFQDHDQSP